MQGRAHMITPYTSGWQYMMEKCLKFSSMNIPKTTLYELSQSMKFVFHSFSKHVLNLLSRQETFQHFISIKEEAYLLSSVICRKYLPAVFYKYWTALSFYLFNLCLDVWFYRVLNLWVSTRTWETSGCGDMCNLKTEDDKRWSVIILYFLNPSYFTAA